MIQGHLHEVGKIRCVIRELQLNLCLHQIIVKGHCVGANACKGQGACKGAGNDCKSHNACKGKGFLEMTKAECAKIEGAKFVDVSMKSKKK